MSPPVDRRAGVPWLLVFAGVALLGAVAAVWSLAEADRPADDQIDVLAGGLDPERSRVEGHLAWLVDAMNGAPLTEAEVVERFSAGFLAAVGADEFVQLTRDVATEGPYEFRGLGEPIPGSAGLLLTAPDGDQLSVIATVDFTDPATLSGALISPVELPTGPFDWVVLTLHLIASLALVGAGLFVWERRRNPRQGLLFVAAGLAWEAQLLELASWSVAYTLGIAAGPLALAVVTHALLSHPSGRLEHGADRLLAAVAYGAGLVGLAPFIAIDTAAIGLPDNLLAGSHDRDLAESLLDLRAVVALAVGSAVFVRLVQHHRDSTPLGRRAHLPVVVGAGILLACVVVVGVGQFGETDFDLSQSAVLSLGAAAVPFGVSVGTLLGRYELGGAATLAADLGDAAGAGLQESLARALGDPTVEIVHWSAELDGYVNAAGSSVTLPDDDHRAVTLLSSGSEPLGAVVHDPALLAEPERVRVACAAARFALDNERLQAQVRAQLVEVRASRARIVESAEQARREVERNLHDGAQQRLLGVVLSLRLEEQRVAERDPEFAAYLAQVGQELTAAVDELRELSSGLHPSILDRGLGPAIEALAERSPVPVEVEADVGRCDPAVEAAAHYVVSECLVNVARHARSDHARVEVHLSDRALTVSISDRGVGGATAEPGHGLEGLEDRVLALGGSWSLDSPAGVGTTVRASFPLTPSEEN